MKHLYEYEDEEIKSMMSDLEEVGHEPYVGYMWVGTLLKMPLGFIVTGKDEAECANIVASSGILKNDDFLYSSTAPKLIELKRPDLKSFGKYLDSAFEAGRINDSGYYGVFKPRVNGSTFKYWHDNYNMNPKYCYDQAKEYFSNADEILSKESPFSVTLEIKKNI